jgi:hypothetical protein
MDFNFITDENVVRAYNDLDNFQVIDNYSLEAIDATVVYFSSNGLYYPNTRDNFINTVLVKDRFEWKSQGFINAKRLIFIRDIRKQWYIGGVNKNIPDIESITSLINKYHESSQLICVGSSAGGYAAVLFGCLLKASYVISFNGQFSLNDEVKKNQNIILKGSKSDFRYYYNLFDLIQNSETVIYYMYSRYSRLDSKQSVFIKNLENVIMLPFICFRHALPISPKILNFINFSDIKKKSKLPTLTIIFLIRYTPMKNMRKALTYYIRSYFELLVRHIELQAGKLQKKYEEK